MSDLMNAQNLEKGELNRCRILEKLSLVRERAQKCLTGFGVPIKEGMARMRVLSCTEAWKSTRLGDLVILPGFPYPATTTMLNCYPFNSESLTKDEKIQCLTNIYSPKCASSTFNMMDNYYCCGGSF
jgi:hypothetical protein